MSYGSNGRFYAGGWNFPCKPGTYYGLGFAEDWQVSMPRKLPTEEELNAASPYPLMVKFTLRVLDALDAEYRRLQTKEQEALKRKDRTAYWEWNTHKRNTYHVSVYYLNRLHHWREPSKYTLPDAPRREQ